MGGVELQYEWWEYFLIPWIAGAVGYITNVIALRMTFYPIDFVGCELWRYGDEPWGLFGWQGIVPSTAAKMAGISMELFTKKLLSISEIFHRIDPAKFSEVMADPTLLMMDQIINEVAVEYMPTVWTKLPKEVKDDVVVTMDSERHSFMAEFIQDVEDHIEDVVDVKHMAVEACVANRALIVQVFLECGEQEFKFIRRSGFYFGFLFGILQMTIWFFYDAAWILPAAGFAVGWFTNYIALKIIFRPLEPRRILCWKDFQGLFLKRQNEVSATFARVVMTDIIHVKAIWEAIFTGPLSGNLKAMLRAHTLVFVDRLLAEVRPVAVAALGAETYAQMKEDVAQKVVEKLPTIIDHSYAYTQEALDMENTVRENLQKLSPSEFEGVL